MKKEDYFRYRVQGGDIYVLPEEIFNELFNELINIQSENKQLLIKNQKRKEVIDKISKILHEIDESIKATGGYPSNYMDELLDILKEV